jgi:hypothetical protein
MGRPDVKHLFFLPFNSFVRSGERTGSFALALTFTQARERKIGQ